ncbi:MAG: hypothetical protein COB98_07715 [Flavobacteriaceae bacterium]|nr:MAG: hypothetical protein COB98_07715 [Flavobacteriaceae bacterium]
MLFLMNVPLNAQEFRSIKHYRKVTGERVLKEGAWLKKDRNRNRKTWKTANSFNLNSPKGFEKYQSVSQIRDFYAWFDAERIDQGRLFKSAGIAEIAAKQLSKVDQGCIRFFIVRNSEVVRFVNEGSKQVFEFAFPLMQERNFSTSKLSKVEAVTWDKNNGFHEQCEVLSFLYSNLSYKALKRLEKMAKGKGIFKFGVPKRLRFTGDISNCEHRFLHGATVLLKEYDRQH